MNPVKRRKLMRKGIIDTNGNLIQKHIEKIEVVVKESVKQEVLEKIKPVEIAVEKKAEEIKPVETPVEENKNKKVKKLVDTE